MVRPRVRTVLFNLGELASLALSSYNMLLQRLTPRRNWVEIGDSFVQVFAPLSSDGCPGFMLLSRSDAVPV